MNGCPCFPFSLADTIRSLCSFLQVIPQKTALARFAAEGHGAEISDFCSGIVLGMVQAMENPTAPEQEKKSALQRGRPRGGGRICGERQHGGFYITPLFFVGQIFRQK